MFLFHKSHQNIYYTLENFKCLAHIDDGISGHRDQKLTQSSSKILRNDLYNSGFIPDEEKCYWDPAQCGQWLRFLLGMIKFQFQIPEERLIKSRAS